MAEPAANSADGSAKSNELAALRQLLVGAEFDRLARLEARVADPARIEKAFSNAVRRNPIALAEAVFPLIGPAIRRSIGAALKEFAETLAQIVEKSFSFRSIRWRVESLVSGKPFGDILLARSLLYSVEQVFLIQRGSGLLLQHTAAHGAVVRDADMISGMLTAIQDFVSDSFAESGQDLETIDVGRYRLWITYAPKIMLVGVVSGVPPGGLKEVFRNALDGIGESLRDRTGDFERSDLKDYETASRFLEDCLRGQHPDRRKKVRSWPFFAAAVVLIMAPLLRLLYTQAQWSRYFDALKRQPGIVVTNVEKRGPQWVVSGLQDPDAADPASLLRALNLDPSEIRFAWQPFLSLNTPFAARRELQSTIGRIRKQIIHFDASVSKIATSAADRIDDLSGAISDLARLRPDARISVIGHADEAPTSALNQKLSLARADQVVVALAAQGAKREMLVAVGIGSTEPLRTGNSDWDRYANRSVSFKVSVP